MRLIWILLLSLMTAVVLASGTRSADISPQLVTSYPLLRDEQLPMILRYIGSSGDSHILMVVKTSFAGGRPFDHLFAYRYPRQALQIDNGWEVPVDTVHAEPHHCPSFQLRADITHIQLPKDRLRYKFCLREINR